MEIIDKNEIWKCIKKRETEKKPDGKITEEQWRKHFMALLEGKDSRNTDLDINEPQNEPEKEIENIDREEITKEEIEQTIKNLKKKKSAGKDGMKNEAWIYADEKTKEKLREILQKIWKNREIPNGWKEGLIYSIHKKGSKMEVGNYRDITAYKIYATILERKLRKEADRLKIFPDTQAGLRKGRRCMDNIYALKIAAEKIIIKKKGKLHVFFADLKVAFDRINRKLLWKRMKEYGINEKLIGRITDIYKETVSRIIVGYKYTKKFWTERELRQGCPLSPLLFVIFIEDIEEFKKKKTKWRNCNRKEKNVYLSVRR